MLGADEDIQNELIVFPNPTSDIIHIRSHAGSVSAVEVVDINGKLMIRKGEGGMKGSALSIDAKTWDPGVYIIKIIRDKKASSIYKVAVSH